MIYDIIIIGAGISGLNTAYQLLLLKKDLQILILEKNNYLGGRIKTFSKKINNHNYTFEEGAGRFNDKHKLLLQLIYKLNLHTKIIKINSDISFLPNSSYNPFFINKNPLEYIKIVVDKSKEIEKSILQSYSFDTYASTVLSKEELKFVFDSYGYYIDLKENAYDAIHMFEEDMLPNIQFYSLNGGFSQIINKLCSNIITYGTKILKNQDVKNIKFDPNMQLFTITTQNSFYQSKITVCTMPKSVLLKLPIFKSIKPLLNSIQVASLCRIYSIFKKKDIWFSKIGKTTTNNDVRFIIPIDKKYGLIMISYTDSKFANKWYKLYIKNKKKFIENIKENINKTFHAKIANPIYTKICYWKTGIGLWKEKYDSHIISKKILQPFDIPLFICGENYSTNQSWIEGSLETSHMVINKMIK